MPNAGSNSTKHRKAVEQTIIQETVYNDVHRIYAIPSLYTNVSGDTNFCNQRWGEGGGKMGENNLQGGTAFMKIY